ncbi:MAG: amino acid permease [Gemmatimonadota bacterium]|nr:amino acid permease [Gemmatimonadota bacterium]
MAGTLKRTLRTRDLLLIVIGTVIGSGIFVVPGAVLRQTDGRVGVALLVWLVAGVLSLLGALTYAELGAAKPSAGGLYAYIRDAFGPLPAFLYGWATFFVISTGSAATLAVAFAGYLDQLVSIGPMTSKLVAVLMIAVVAVVNVRGARQGADVQNWGTVIKAGAIVLLSVMLLVSGGGLEEARLAGLWPDAVSGSVLSGVGLAVLGVLWAYEGWQYVTFSAGEARDPQRTLPVAIIAGTATLIGIYLLANVGYIAALGPENAAATDRIAAEAAGTLFGPMAGKLVALVILVSMFSATNGLALTSPRLYFAMSRDGLFFRRLAEVHPRFGTPAFAIVASSIWAAVLAVSGTFEQLLTYVVFAGWIFYALGALSVFVFRRREPDRVRPFGVPWYPVTPLLFVAAAAAIVINTLVVQPVQSLLGLGAVFLGLPAYFIWRARSKLVHRSEEIAKPPDDKQDL